MPTPIAWWKLDELSGTTVADQMGTYSLTTVGTPTWSAGQFGNALTFVKLSSQYAQRTISNGNSLRVGLSNFTICVWIKFTTAPVVGEDNGICGCWNSSNNYWYFQRQASGILHLDLASQPTASYVTAVSTGTITDTAWHHAAVSVVRAGNATFYIDGVSAGVVDVTVCNGDTFDGAATSEFNLGSIGTHQGGYFLNGALDDVQIFLSALSQAEIQAVMAGVTWQQEGYWWRRDDGNEAAASYIGAQDSPL